MQSRNLSGMSLTVTSCTDTVHLYLKPENPLSFFSHPWYRLSVLFQGGANRRIHELTVVSSYPVSIEARHNETSTQLCPPNTWGGKERTTRTITIRLFETICFQILSFLLGFNCFTYLSSPLLSARSPMVSLFLPA